MPRTRDALDLHVGARVRLRRVMLGVTQQHLALALGVTFQQVQKYEKGLSRIGAARLQTIAQELKVPLGYFFEGGPITVADRSAAPMPESDPAQEVLQSPEGVALARAFARIGDPRLRRRIVALVEEMANVLLREPETAATKTMEVAPATEEVLT